MIHQEITIVEIILLMKVVQEIHIVVLMMRVDTTVIASRTTITIVDIVPLSMIQEGAMTAVDTTQEETTEEETTEEETTEEAILEVVTINLQEQALREEVIKKIN